MFMWSCPCRSGSSDRAEEKKPLEEVLRKVVKNLGPKGRMTEEEVALAWENAAGHAARRHSRPVSFNKTTLVVNVDGSSWLYNLTLKKKEILGKMSGVPGGGKFKDIRFRIGDLK